MLCIHTELFEYRETNSIFVRELLKEMSVFNIMYNSDLEVIEGMKQGKLIAFRELYVRYADLIYRNILVRVNSSFDADDIFQDFFIKLWEKSDHLHIETNVRSYLLVALKHHILNTIKEQQIRNKYHKASFDEKDEADDYTWVKITSEDLNDRLQEVVETFPPRLKEVYMLSREKNLSVKEIAEKLSISEQTVKNQLTDILKRLKNEMKNRNFIFFI